MSTYKLVCPACAGPLRIRTSEGQTPCFRAIYFQCMNLICGATFNGSLSIDYTLSPSALEKPLTAVPIAPYIERQRAAQDLRKPTPQSDLLDHLEHLQ